MSVRASRIGLIVPSSNTVMEPDFHRQLGSDAIVSTTRIFLEDVTREAEIRMLEQELPQAVERIRTTSPQVVVFGCTSAGALGALAHDRSIAEMIARESGADAITVLDAVVRRLEDIRPAKLAVFTPYVEDLTNSLVRCLNEAGFCPVKTASMGLIANLEIGRVTPPEIVQFVSSHISDIAPDCVFLSCTNWRALEAIPVLESRLRIPILSSNQAAIDIVSQSGEAIRPIGGRLSAPSSSTGRQNNTLSQRET